MTLLYRGPSARITHEVIETHAPYYQTYRICELYLVHVIREGIVDVAVGSPTMRACSTAMAGLSVIVATASDSLDSPSTTVAAAIGAAMAAGVAVKGWRIRTRPIAIWAYHRGERVCLFQTRDRLVFGQVKRALLRALERIEDAR